MSQPRILVVDDEAVIREAVKRILEQEGYEVITATSGHTALEKVQIDDFTVVISDLKMPGMGGMEVLKSIKILQPDVPVIIITGYATVETAVDAIKNGAFDYLSKPFTPPQVKEMVNKAIEQRKLSGEGGSLGNTLNEHRGFHRFVGDSKAMQKVYGRILQVAPTDSTVLITGESGTGKELVARAIHENSARKDMPFVAIDCTALAESLLESELFGHEKGSFTGASQTKVGLFKVANGGTLFLDEVSNISLSSQAKLLRVIQEREVTPIGGTKPQPIDIRLISATNKNLRELSNEGDFREDLYFRLNTIPIDMPPLRERSGDLPLLVGYFLRKFADEINKEIKGVSPAAMNLLEDYDFPGNVRELEHMIERAVVLTSGDMIMPGDLGMHGEELIGAGDDDGYVPATTEELKEMKRKLREEAVKPIEKSFVLEALKRNDWNITRAAEDVGMLRPNFQALMKKLQVSARDRKVD
ncbi:sigma-54 dependent transcriptional regulator [Desulfuromonas acetoxidans]|uniref:Two component, sigma54 specific, transcriptional regulator, Fis family n=1 Tax=Desulfuromonas acetoxidans (strain DSM 684 / 11070) TaxID=281689 RepID=Q1JWD7_DESA6|nr:sigma-54 dependent transcriptional regulator [Desulfuromonas acetoxidans]EAT14546.1 two component, sigma54 specific, transcriptional regulator, Fis family [Desulfuromonas acetoxidans DSM 684]MBF0645617.1 sigma-54-dependent Fis family transcriptional regulator [Desulfuromonas acetoxidans]NVD24332.1 sigma-54-dependent Fis family transcriptional regulator [Desulfuromonas acetoxidans]NVE14895.1 sigma-54-dependent Fis family transcriptional regulator [Desulfuromonas acetoxidans]